MMVYLKQIVSLQFNPGLFTGCGRCLEVCPRDVFKLSGKLVEIQHRDQCIECGACMINCPAAVLNGMLRNAEPNFDCDGGNCC